MNKTDFLNKMIIKDVVSMGDRWHNQDIEMFMDGVKQNAMSRKVQDFIVAVNGGVKENRLKTVWIHRSMSKGDLKRLRTLCRAKAPATKVKRMKAFLDHQLAPHYGALLNKRKIEKFMDIVM